MPLWAQPRERAPASAQPFEDQIPQSLCRCRVQPDVGAERALRPLLGVKPLELLLRSDDLALSLPGEQLRDALSGLPEADAGCSAKPAADKRADDAGLQVLHQGLTVEQVDVLVDGAVGHVHDELSTDFLQPLAERLARAADSYLSQLTAAEPLRHRL